MKELQRKIDFERRRLDELLLELARERKAREHEWQKHVPERLERAMEFLQSANNELFMAMVALNGGNNYVNRQPFG